MSPLRLARTPAEDDKDSIRKSVPIPISKKLDDLAERLKKEKDPEVVAQICGDIAQVVRKNPKLAPLGLNAIAERLGKETDIENFREIKFRVNVILWNNPGVAPLVAPQELLNPLVDIIGKETDAEKVIETADLIDSVVQNNPKLASQELLNVLVARFNKELDADAVYWIGEAIGTVGWKNPNLSSQCWDVLLKRFKNETNPKIVAMVAKSIKGYTYRNPGFASQELLNVLVARFNKELDADAAWCIADAMEAFFGNPKLFSQCWDVLLKRFKNETNLKIVQEIAGAIGYYTSRNPGLASQELLDILDTRFGKEADSDTLKKMGRTLINALENPEFASQCWKIALKRLNTETSPLNATIVTFHGRVYINIKNQMGSSPSLYQYLSQWRLTFLVCV